jgi:hypothetical protein
MSLNLVPLPVVKSLDPRLDIKEQPRRYVVQTGAQINSFQTFFQGTPSNSSISISCNPPSAGIVVSRKVLKRAIFDITVTGTNESKGPLLVSNCHAPRFMPINAVTTSESMTINNVTISETQQLQTYPYLMRYHNNFNDKLDTIYPSYMDAAQTYKEGLDTFKNPLADYLNSSCNDTRGSYVGYEVLDNKDGGTSATIRLTVIEPILMSPFVHGAESDRAEGLIGVQNMAYNCTFSNLSRVVSLDKFQGGDDGSIINITGVSTNLSEFSLLFNYLTPDPLTSPLPMMSVYTQYNLTTYSTRFNAVVAPGAFYNMVLNSVQVSSIPKRIYIFAKKTQSDETSFTTDTSMAIDCMSGSNPMQLTWNNNQFLASSTGIDLYNISKNNGNDSSIAEFSKHVGSVICLEFGKDIGLAPDQASGVIGNYQLGLSVNMRNTSSDSITPTLFVVCVSEGALSIVNGSCTSMFGIISRDDVLNSPVDNTIQHVRRNIYGGSWKGFKDMLSKGYQYVKDNKLISKGLEMSGNPYAQAGAKVASALGFGITGAGVTGGRMMGSGFQERKTNRKKGQVYLSDFN